MSVNCSNSELEAFLDESLPVDRMTAIEDSLRHSDDLRKQLTAIIGRRDAGVHSLGEIWRRHRLSCPPHEQLGSYLMGVLPKGTAGYIKFHLETIQCRYCSASVDDLTAQQSAADAGVAERRRHKYFKSSAGYLRKK